MTAAWRILHLGCPCLTSLILAGSKLFPPKSKTRPPTKLPRCRSAAFSDREQVDKPASLDGKGRPGCHERPSYLDAWLSCAGSGELAPEVGILNLEGSVRSSGMTPAAPRGPRPHRSRIERSRARWGNLES